MRLGKQIKATVEWENSKLKTTKNVVSLKFDQNNAIREKLLSTTGNLYEATLDKFYGCGFSLAQCHMISQANVKCGNNLGRILRE